jgi:hypothetical protein
MNPKVRSTLADDFAQGQACSICGQESLSVVHLDAYPDYVNCDQCGSAFVVEEGGERVMYGKIPAQYPETRHFALQQWVWPEAIARKSAPERAEGVVPPAPTPPAAPPPEPEVPPEPPTEPEPPLEEMLGEPSADVTPLVDEGPAEPPPDEIPEPETTPPPTWPPPPLSDADTETEIPPEDEMLVAESEGAADVFGADDESADAFEAESAEPSEATPWESGPPAEIIPPPEPSAPELESDVGDEEDLLDRLWGDEPETAPSDEPSDVPAQPDWVSGLTSEAEEPPTAEPEDEAPVEADADTSSRLHTWGAPQAETPDDEAAAPGEEHAPDEDETVRIVDDQPPAVAPFEEGGWADDSFSQPEEAPPETQMAQAPPLPSEGDDEEPAAETAEEPAAIGAEDAGMAEMAEAYWGGQQGAPPKEEPPIEEDTDAEPEHHEPPPGNRFRVVVKGASVRYPDNVCSHCQFSPAPARLPVLASVSISGIGERQLSTLRIPVCMDCKARADARSEEQRTAQLQAHLIGVLVALVLIVCGLGIGFINLRENLVPALVGLIVMAGLGYVVPAVPLLLRASRMPKPEDSDYVRSTLRVPGDTEGTETAFEWRNQGYARRFRQANDSIAVSEVIRVREDSG